MKTIPANEMAVGMRVSVMPGDPPRTVESVRTYGSGEGARVFVVLRADSGTAAQGSAPPTYPMILHPEGT